MQRRFLLSTLSLAAGLALSTAAFAGGSSSPPGATSQEKALLRWNKAAMEATGLDHTAPAPGEERRHREQLGPLRASRSMAIVHLAMVDAVLAYTGGYKTYSGLPLTPAGQKVSLEAALAYAAHATLVSQFPAQIARFNQWLAEDLASNRAPLDQVAAGRALGLAAANAILALRANDGSNHPEPRYGIEYQPSTEPGQWRQDPVSGVPIAMGAEWAQRVKPFALTRADQFRLPPPPAFNSATFAKAYEELRALGGDGVNTPTRRNLTETQTGIFWAYDGVPSLCAPPRLYNQVANQVDAENPRFHDNDWIVWRSKDMETLRPLVDRARYLALANVAMADAGLAAWDSKYFYKIGRPITVIREGLPGTQLVADPNFVPLGAPASNLTGPNFTPPFPAYPSGHATFGGALFQIMRKMKGGDYNAFTFVSDELNGQTKDNTGTVRPYAPRSYVNFTKAEKENGRSRVYLGIHWDFDSTEGIKLGNQVANHVFATILRPLVVTSK